jgi:hypothetical protein
VVFSAENLSVEDIAILSDGLLETPSSHHYSQVKLKALLSMSKITHLLPVYPIKI